MTAWPSNVTLGVLTVGPFIGPAGEVEAVRVWAEPVLVDGTEYLVHGTTGVSFPPLRESVDGVDGQVQLQLPLCDDPTLTAPDGSPAGPWHYRVHVEVINAWREHWVIRQDVTLTTEAPYQRMAGSLDGPPPVEVDHGLGVSVSEPEPGMYVLTGPGVVQTAPGVIQVGQ